MHVRMSVRSLPGSMRCGVCRNSVESVTLLVSMSSLHLSRSRTSHPGLQCLSQDFDVLLHSGPPAFHLSIIRTVRSQWIKFSKFRSYIPS